MARKQKKYHYIYKTTNLKNGKYYIGMHSTDNLNDGYLGSGKNLKRSLKKYGKEKFKFEILEFVSDRKSLSKREKELVNKELLKDNLSMNMKEGGSGGFINEEHRLKFINEGSKNGRLKTNEILKLKYGDDEKWINRFNSYVIKKAWTNPSFRKKILKNIDWTGKKHKEESKKKIGEKNSIHQKKEKNSQFGTCWITNGIENKKILKNSTLPDGWYLGRIMKPSVV